MHVVVVGAGLAGLTAAHALAQAGAEVSVLDRREGPGLETSARNGSLQHPSHAEPWNSPGVFMQLLRSLGREDAAMLLRLKALPSLWRWGLQFLRHANADHHRAASIHNLQLAQYSLQQMARLRASGLAYHHQACGTVVPMRDPAQWARAKAWAEALQGHGLVYRALDPAAAVALEPALAGVSQALAGALHYPGDERGDPAAFCTALATRLTQTGSQLHVNWPVQSIETAAGRVVAVVGAQGRRLAADAVVLAAASHSTGLAAGLGLRLPVQPVKGYSITTPRGAHTPQAPRMAVIDPDAHIAVVPVGDDRLRVAGTAEFTGFDLQLQPRRVANLVALLRSLFPAYADTLRAEDIQPWTGLRPMCADGRCLTGATRVPGLWLHTGHGQLGWTLSAGSAQLLADLMFKRPTAVAAAPFAPARFAL